LADQETFPLTDTKKPRVFYGYIVVVASFFIMVVNYGTANAFGVFFKPVLFEFGWTRAMTSGAFSLAKLVQGLLGIVMGGLTDRFGPRVVMTLCSFLLGLGYLLMSRISTPWHLYLFYGVIIGAGMSGAFVPLTSTVAKWFVERRSMMTGIVLTGIGTGTLIAPPVASRLISAHDWRVAYIILGGAVLVFIALAAQLLRRDPTQVGQRPYGRTKEEESRLTSGTPAFPLREAIYTSQFWLVSFMFLSLGFCIFAIMVHIVPHATDLGISTSSAANILATIGGMSIVGKVGLGIVADRIGNRWALIIGFILMSTSLFWLMPAREAWMLYLFAVVYGFAYGGSTTVESPLVADLFGLSSHGLIMGVTGLGFTIGAGAGPFVAAYIFDVTGSYQMAFLICAVVSLVGLILTVFLTPTKIKHNSPKLGNFNK
jgi:MFS family permease